MKIVEHYKDAFSRDHFSIGQKLTVPLRWIVDDYYPWLPNPLRGLKYFWQRGTRGWSDYDLSGFDTHLAHIIASGIKALNESRHGMPMSIAYNYAKDPEHPENWDHEDNERASQAWGDILDKIVKGFEIMIEDEWWYKTPDGKEDPDPKTWAKESPEMEEALDLFREYFQSFWI